MLGVFESIAVKFVANLSAAGAAKLIKKLGTYFWEKKLGPLAKSWKLPSSTTNAARTYLTKLEAATGSVTTIVKPNGSTRLSEIYVPLTLVDPVTGLKTRLSQYPSLLLEKNTRMLIVDTAGMGKSTAIKFLVQSALLQLQSIPMLVELRKLGTEEPILCFLARQFLGSRAQETCDRMSELLKQGGSRCFLMGTMR